MTCPCNSNNSNNSNNSCGPKTEKVMYSKFSIVQQCTHKCHHDNRHDYRKKNRRHH